MEKPLNLRTIATLFCFLCLFSLSILLIFCLSLQDGGKEFTESVLDERTSKVEAWHRDSAARAPYTKPAQPITCATFAKDVLEGRASVSQGHEHKHQPLLFGPASLVGRNLTTERERMAAQVFQPGHRYSMTP